MGQLVASKIKRFPCGDYVHCLVNHNMKEGRKIVGRVTEMWCENFKGQRTSKVWYEANVGTKHRPLMHSLKEPFQIGRIADQDTNLVLDQGCGQVARFSSVDAAAKVLARFV